MVSRCFAQVFCIAYFLSLVGGWQQEQATVLWYSWVYVVRNVFVSAVYWFFKVQLAPWRFFRLFLVLLLFCFLSERLTGNVFLLAELSSQDIQQKFYAFGHMKAMTLSTLQPLLSRHKAAPMQTFHRVAKIPVCTGFPNKTRVSHSSANWGLQPVVLYALG